MMSRETPSSSPHESSRVPPCDEPCRSLLSCSPDRVIHVRSPVHGLRPLALVVSGQALGYIFADDRLQNMFLSLAMASTAVVACRVSPPQKAAIVRMVRKHVPGNPVTLAIGDGANDVDMIKQAEVRTQLLMCWLPPLSRDLPHFNELVY
jgi:hypothetical protein